MRDALKPSLYCDEEPHNMEFCANLCDCSLWPRHFFDASWTQHCLASTDLDKTANQHKST